MIINLRSGVSSNRGIRLVRVHVFVTFDAFFFPIISLSVGLFERNFLT